MTLYTCYQSILSNHHNGILIFEQTYRTMYKTNVAFHDTITARIEYDNS